MVVIFHVFCRFPQVYLSQNIPILQHWGEFGVTIFLLISSYYLFPKRFKPNVGDGGVNYFFKEVYRKLRRLWLPYGVCLTITFIVGLVLPIPGRGGGFIEYFCNLFFLNGYIDVGYIDRAHWYMTTLISLIVICTLLKSLCVEDKAESYFLWLGIILFLKVVNLDSIAHLLGDTYVGIACIGFSFSALVKSGKIVDFDFFHLKWYAVLIFSIVTVIHYFEILRLLFIVVGIFLIFGCLHEKMKILEKPFFQFFGGISYVLYLIHQNIAYTIVYYLMRYNDRYYFWLGFIAFFSVVALALMIEILIKRIYKTLQIN